MAFSQVREKGHGNEVQNDRAIWVHALPNSLCCVLGQDTLFSQYVSPLRPSGRLLWKPTKILASLYTPEQETLPWVC